MGRFWEDIKGKVDVFLEKDRGRRHVQVEQRIERGGRIVGFQDFNSEPRPDHEEVREESVRDVFSNNSVTEDDPTKQVVVVPVMSEVDPEESETRQKTRLSEISTLKKENKDMKMALQEMRTKLSVQETALRQVEERCMRMEAVITQIADFSQQQNAAVESSRALMNSLVEEVRIHHVNFQLIGMVMEFQSSTLCGVALSLKRWRNTSKSSSKRMSRKD